MPIIISLTVFQLGEDTWYYSKRCFLSLVETLAKHMTILKDSTYTEILQFLDAAEEFGRNIQIVNKQL